MEACIMICNSKKPSHKVGKVLFIDAKKEVERKNAQSRLAPGHIQKILSAYRDYESIDHFSYVATEDEIRSRGCNIAIQMYVTADESASDRKVDLKSAVLNWEIGSLRTSGCIDELVKMF
jgi:type I restriction enzyme M protein